MIFCGPVNQHYLEQHSSGRTWADYYTDTVTLEQLLTTRWSDILEQGGLNPLSSIQFDDVRTNVYTRFQVESDVGKDGTPLMDMRRVTSNMKDYLQQGETTENDWVATQYFQNWKTRNQPKVGSVLINAGGKIVILSLVNDIPVQVAVAHAGLGNDATKLKFFDDEEKQKDMAIEAHLFVASIPGSARKGRSTQRAV